MEKEGARTASQAEPRREMETLVDQSSRGIAYKGFGGERAKRGCCLRGTLWRGSDICGHLTVCGPPVGGTPRAGAQTPVGSDGLCCN